jgi:hypothetical protein
MPAGSRVVRLALASLVALNLTGGWSQPQPAENAIPVRAEGAPEHEELFYRAEWRLVHAGNVRLSWAARPGNDGWSVRMTLQSAGVVSRLHRVNNEYSALFDAGLCAVESALRAHEGRKRRQILVRFDGAGRKASYLERDLARDTVVATQEIDIPECVHDVIGGLYRLRAMRVEPGQVVYLPISDGKKSVSARVEAQARETLRIEKRTYQTIRYEAFLFNNVLYRRSGRLFVWLTDDESRLPVRIRVRLPFYIGTVTLDLQPDRASGHREPSSGESS